jgi:alpha-glucosidase
VTDPSPDWWRTAVCYQVYPRSFQDSNGDGIGDLPGIISRLDYLRDLGIDAIWLSPTYPSPMRDLGYDITDYCDVHPEFGTLADMDRLIAECHARGLRLLLDFVPNHTSDEHPWFKESRSSRTSPRRDWYYWRDPKPDGSPPNNWLSVFGGSAWRWDQDTAQYYLHSFLPEQPDLNWRNPEVVAAMHDVLRFWLRRGVDGFRIDVMHMLLKHPDLADNPLNPAWLPGMPERQRQIWAHNRNYPDVHHAVRGIRQVLDEFPGAMAVGEVTGSADDIASYYELGGLHLAFNFQLIQRASGASFTEWDAAAIARVVDDAHRALPSHAQPCFAFNNHDQPRFVSRHDADGHGQLRARAAALLLLGLRGTPFLYYGEEIGMVDGDIPEERLTDTARLYGYPARDPERTPMQWSAGPGRGFTTAAEPWLPFGPPHISVEAQEGDPGSLLELYRRAIAIRRSEPALQSGAEVAHSVADDCYSFVREAAGSRVLVAVNTALAHRSILAGPGTVIVSTVPAIEGSAVQGKLDLLPLAAAWVRLAG